MKRRNSEILGFPSFGLQKSKEFASYVYARGSEIQIFPLIWSGNPVLLEIWSRKSGNFQNLKFPPFMYGMCTYFLE